MLRTFLNGIIFGVTKIVPGVSGGTIAVALGFYDQMLESLNHLSKDCRRHLRFLLPFLLGIITGVIAFSSAISFLLANFSLPTMSLFIGMIAGIIPFIYKKIKQPGEKLQKKQIALITIPAALLILVSHLRIPQAADPAQAIGEAGAPFIIFIFFAGIVAAAALITPGISGSFILLLFGVYHIVAYSVSLLPNPALPWPDILKVLAPFGAGVLIGLFSMARLVEKLLKNHSQTVYAVILGLILGSVYALFNEPITFQSGVSAAAIIVAAATFLSGCALSYLLSRNR